MPDQSNFGDLLGFIDESLYTGPGTRLQSQQEEFEMRTEKFRIYFINYRGILMSGSNRLEMKIILVLRVRLTLSFGYVFLTSDF